MEGITLDPVGGSRLGVFPRCQLVPGASGDAFETGLAPPQWRLNPTDPAGVLFLLDWRMSVHI